MDHASAVTGHSTTSVDAQQRLPAGPPSGRKRPRKYTRSTRGCYTCRESKVKCDETSPSCLRCLVNRRACKWPTEEELAHPRKARKLEALKKSEAEAVRETSGSSESAQSSSSGAAASQSHPPPSVLGGIPSPKRTSPAAIIPPQSQAPPDFPAFLEQIFSAAQALPRPLQPPPPPARPPPNIYPPAPPLRAPTISPPAFPDQTSVPPVPPSSSLPPTKRLSSSPSLYHDALARQVAQTTVLTKDPLASLSSSTLASRRSIVKPSEEEGHSVFEAQVAWSGKGPDQEGEREEDRVLAGIDLVALAEALDTDPNLIELGPISPNSPTSMQSQNLMAPTALLDAFPSPFSLQLFHHFCQSASRIMVTMGNRGYQNNPIFRLCTPDRLLDRTKAAKAALRMSMLSSSVAHLENEIVLRDQRRLGRRSPEAQDESNRIRRTIHQLGKRFKVAALANIVLVEEDDTDQFDTVLATCVILMIRDVISASPDWEQNMEYAIRLVSKEGGPQAILDADKNNFSRRFLLENLATHEVFSCFITHKEPVLLQRFDPWWYSCVEVSGRSWEWESVEETFGISRGMVDLIARVVTLDAQRRRLKIDFNKVTPGMQKVEDFMQRQAEGLLLELDVWCNPLSSVANHERVTLGDFCYKYTLHIYILGEILGQPAEVDRIVSAVDCVLELCSEASALRQVVMLVWPLVICGTFCSVHKRQKLRSLLDAFEEDYCEDLRAARSIIEEQWVCLDAGMGKQTYASLMRRLRKNVLLI